MNIWPPFLFSGILVEEIGDDWRYARVRLKLRWYNRNYVKTQFGGALFAMVDPFWMILTLEALRHDYIVWDKAGEIEFVAPGRAMSLLKSASTMRCSMRSAPRPRTARNTCAGAKHRSRPKRAS